MPAGRALAEGRGGPVEPHPRRPAGLGQRRERGAQACAAAGARRAPAPGLGMVAGFAGGRSPTRTAPQFRAQDRLACREIGIVTDGFASLFGRARRRAGRRPGHRHRRHRLRARRRPGRCARPAAGAFPPATRGAAPGSATGRFQAHLKRLDGRLTAESAIFGRIAAIVGRRVRRESSLARAAPGRRSMPPSRPRSRCRRRRATRSATAFWRRRGPSSRRRSPRWTAPARRTRSRSWAGLPRSSRPGSPRRSGDGSCRRGVRRSTAST